MNRLYIRNYFAVAVAGMFCLLSTSIVFAQTATNLNCSKCVNAGEVANNTVRWLEFHPDVRNFLINQANDVNALVARVEELEALVASLQASSVPNLGTYLRIDETDPLRPTAWFEAVNVMVVNGTGTTAGATNGLGNLIVGYDEFQGRLDDNKSGSHNLVVGPEHNYSRYGGFVAGNRNSVLAQYATVSGGFNNTASGLGSNVSGGQSNTASGIDSSVSGGLDNTASGEVSSVSGGNSRAAPGDDDWVAGALFQDN